MYNQHLLAYFTSKSISTNVPLGESLVKPSQLDERTVLAHPSEIDTIIFDRLN